jgi:hypothetical protein
MALKSWPRLVAETTEGPQKTEVGYLQIHSTTKKITIGDTAAREFRLLQCLFSAQNFLSAKYAPVTQTYERLYLSIKTSSDLGNERLKNEKSADSEMTTIVQSAIRTLERGAAGKYLTFVTVGDKLRMEIAGAVAA